MALHWPAFLHFYCVWFRGMFLVSIVLDWYYKSSFHEAWLYYYLLHQQLIRLNPVSPTVPSWNYHCWPLVREPLLHHNKLSQSWLQPPFFLQMIVDYLLLILSVNQQLSPGDALQPNSSPQASLLNCMPCVRSVFCSVLVQTP